MGKILQFQNIQFVRLIPVSTLFLLFFSQVFFANSALETVGLQRENTFDGKIESLERRMSSLKDQIAQSKARLSMLRAQSGVFDSNSRLKVALRNSLDERFVFKSAHIYLNGELIKYVNQIPSKEEVSVYDAFVPEGSHKLKVIMAYNGNSSLFSYFKDYVMVVEDEQSFETRPNSTTLAQIEGYKNGGFATLLHKQPGVRTAFSETLENTAVPELVFKNFRRAKKSKLGENAGIGIVVKNSLGSEFELVNTRVYLNGELLNPNGKITSNAGFSRILSDKVNPGEHMLDVHLVYKGSSPMFKYFPGYHFLVRHSQKLNLKAGMNNQLELISQLPKGGQG